MDAALAREIAQHRHEQPAPGVLDIFRGLLLLTPVGAWLWPKHKIVFDQVLARKTELYVTPAA